jgi:hypothetical protein
VYCQKSKMEDKRNLSFMDLAWVERYGLSRDNALNYFYLSPFYNLESNNQAILEQGSSTTHLVNMIGIEYQVEPNPHEPILFIIKKHNRKSPTMTDTLEVFYIMEKIIYQSPCLMDLLVTKHNKVALYLHQAFEISQKDCRYNQQEGHLSLVHQQAKKAISDLSVIREFPSLCCSIDDLSEFSIILSKEE